VIVQEDNLCVEDWDNPSTGAALEDAEELSRKGDSLPCSCSTCLPVARADALLKRLALSPEVCLEDAGSPYCTFALPMVLEYRDRARFPSMKNLRAGGE
jgi:hypothetical protein